MTDPTYKPEPVGPAPREDRISEVLSYRNVRADCSRPQLGLVHQLLEHSWNRMNFSLVS
jgi:hypothetical protein